MDVLYKSCFLFLVAAYLVLLPYCIGGVTFVTSAYHGFLIQWFAGAVTILIAIVSGLSVFALLGVLFGLAGFAAMELCSSVENFIAWIKTPIKKP